MGNFLISLGVVLHFVGFGFIYIAEGAPTTVNGYGLGPTANFQLLQQQSILYIMGIGALIYGITAIAGGAIVQQMKIKG